VLLLVFAYILLFRLPRKRAREVSQLQAALSVGDQVMLTSGIFGRVEAMLEDKIDVEIAPDVVVTVHRGAIGKIVRDERDADDDGGETVSADSDLTGSSALDAPDSGTTVYGDQDGLDGEQPRGGL
jgi:preprotein translocase subunit YajC